MTTRGRACDLLILGAGPAGIAAACHAAEHGLKVTLVDENPSAGGQIWRGNTQSTTAAHWLARLHATSAQLIAGASVFEIDAPSSVVRAELDGQSATLHYEQLVLATGARERFVPFPGWTLPGVVGAGGVQALIKGGFNVTGRRVVVAGSGPLLMAAAGLLGASGADVIGVLEQTSWRSLFGFAFQLRHTPSKFCEAFDHLRHAGGAPFMANRWVCEAGGDGRLEWIKIDGGSRVRLASCDLLVSGFGLVPNTELAQLAGCELDPASPRSSSVFVDEFQRTSVARLFAAGEICGVGGAELSLTEGAIAGLAAASQWDSARALFSVRTRQRRFAAELEHAFSLRDELRGLPSPETFVCRCEDVTHAALKDHTNWREAKLATRCGMGLCQGRTCGPSTEFLYSWSHSGLRPPAVVTRLGTLADVGADASTSTASSE